MANALFNPGRAGFLSAEIDWDTATIKISLVRGYTFVATHTFVSDLTGALGELVATETLTSKTVADGVADAADVTFPSVPTGTECNALVIYQASAVTGGVDVAATSQRLIAFIDTATGLPVTPNGGNIAVVFDSGESRIFRL